MDAWRMDDLMNPLDFSDLVSKAMDAMPEPEAIAAVESAYVRPAVDLLYEDGLIAGAAHAERERCAKIAENFTQLSRDDDPCSEIAAKIREPFDQKNADQREVAEHPNMLTIRLGGTTTISIMDPSAMGLTIEEFCSEWAYPVLEMAGMKHAGQGRSARYETSQRSVT